MKKLKIKKTNLSASIDRTLEIEMEKRSLNKSKIVNKLLNSFVENQSLIEKYKKYLENK